MADIIARGMAASKAPLGSDGKVPEEYLPSYVDDVIDLLDVSATAPVICAKGDQYYNTTSKLIYTATASNTWGTSGKVPEKSKIYIDEATNPATSYRWDGSNLVLIGADTSDKEDKSNKVTSVSASSTDTQYPSAKCLYDTVGNIETLLGGI